MGPFASKVTFIAKPSVGFQGTSRSDDWPNHPQLAVTYTNTRELSAPIQLTASLAGPAGMVSLIPKLTHGNSAATSVTDVTFEPVYGDSRAVYCGRLNTWGGAGGVSAGNKGGKLVPNHEARFKHWRQLPPGYSGGGFQS